MGPCDTSANGRFLFFNRNGGTASVSGLAVENNCPTVRRGAASESGSDERIQETRDRLQAATHSFHNIGIQFAPRPKGSPPPRPGSPETHQASPKLLGPFRSLYHLTVTGGWLEKSRTAATPRENQKQVSFELLISSSSPSRGQWYPGQTCLERTARRLRGLEDTGSSLGAGWRASRKSPGVTPVETLWYFLTGDDEKGLVELSGDAPSPSPSPSLLSNAAKTLLLRHLLRAPFIIAEEYDVVNVTLETPGHGYDEAVSAQGVRGGGRAGDGGVIKLETHASHTSLAEGKETAIAVRSSLAVRTVRWLTSRGVDLSGTDAELSAFRSKVPAILRRAMPALWCACCVCVCVFFFHFFSGKRLHTYSGDSVVDLSSVRPPSPFRRPLFCASPVERMMSDFEVHIPDESSMHDFLVAFPGPEDSECVCLGVLRGDGRNKTSEKRIRLYKQPTETRTTLDLFLGLA